MRRRTMLFLLFAFVTITTVFEASAANSAADSAADSAATGSSAGCPGIEGIFFDLGDTLVENDGTGTFVLRP